VLRRVREQGDVPGTLERHGQFALVSGARPCLAPRLDLRPPSDDTDLDDLPF